MKLKKMLAVLSAAAMLCGSAAAMSVSAANNPCDVNGDGSVSLLDVMMVNRYLLGEFYLNDTSVLDVNGNYVVDTVDAQQIMAATINMTFEWYFT